AKDTYLSTTMLRLLFFPVIPVLIHFMFPIIPSVILGLWIARYQLLIKPEQHLKKLYYITIIGLAISLIGALPLSFIG
ncbi:glyoxalase, partial [Bacillus wiedmannii]